MLSVGRVSHEKRIEIMLAAYAALRRELPGLRLAIVGEGPARGTLEAASPRGVRFLGELHGRELAEAYASADVFCFPSTTDTFGQVLLEAAGIAGRRRARRRRRRTGTSRRHGAAGAARHPASLAGGLRLLALDGDLRARLGADGRRAALARRLVSIARGAPARLPFRSRRRIACPRAHARCVAPHPRA